MEKVTCEYAIKEEPICTFCRDGRIEEATIGEEMLDDLLYHARNINELLHGIDKLVNKVKGEMNVAV